MVAEAARKNILDEVRETLEREQLDMDAASCTFYVRDPFWPDEMLRLIAMPGVRLKEPMHGFSFPPHSKKVLAEGEAEIFEPASMRDEHQLREDSAAPLEGIPEDRRRLFGDFIMREGIGSSARLWHLTRDAGGKERIEAVLFVNYARPREFDEALKARIRGLLDGLVENLPAIHDEMRVSETEALVQAIRIFPPKHADSADDTGDREQQLEKYLESLLSLALEALALDPLTTFGTVHLYHEQTQTLSLAASCGLIGDVSEARKPLSVPKGDGIISWVAVRRKAVLIADLKSSDFGKIHITINPDVRSEVAIPIFHGKTLLGVLNLESYLPNAFPATCVRSLWFAVNRAAEAIRLLKQVNVNQRLTRLSSGLLAFCAEAVDTESVGHFSLDKLAELVAKELEAARCGIWRYDADELKFELSGISPSDFDPKPPRRGGWSSLIRELGGTVRIDIREGGAGFSVRYWNGKGWNPSPPGSGLPEMINPSVEPGVRSLLGIPITVRKQVTGVAWLEYENSPEAYTEDELMRLASGLMAYAGLVIEFSQVDLVDKKAVQEIGDKLSEHLLAPGRLNLEGFPQIEVFVKSQNYGDSSIGGDFYAARVIDDQTAGVLLGDAEGHAVQGAINMLPMLSVFESFWKESRSVTHIMDKIMGASKKLGLHGTAVYCVFTVIEQALWLSVTSAGHGPLEGPPLIYYPKGGWPDPFPKKESPACGAMLGVELIRQPLAEARMKLASGDVIVIYTDGLELKFTEVMDIRPSAGQSPGAIAEEVFDAARRKRGGAPFDDDATVMVISVK